MMTFEPIQRDWSNWNGNYACQIESLFLPQTREELIALTINAGILKKKIKVIGAGHSTNDIALPEEWAVSLEKLAQVLEIGPDTVTVQTGITLKELNEILAQKGLMLENLGSISDQTVGGVFQTGTHGTGAAFGSLHTQIVSMTLINGKGELKTVTPDSPLFLACQCGLGMLGIVDTVTLRVIPATMLHERTFPAPWPDLLDQLDDFISANDHFKFYWFPYTNCAGIWIANRTNKEPYSSSKNEVAVNEDLLEMGPTDPDIIAQYNRAFFEADFDRLRERIDRSDRIFNVDCSAHKHCRALEAAFPARHAKAFLLELQELIEKNHFPAHTGTEVRFVKADQAFLSPAYSATPDDIFCFVGAVSIPPNGHPIPYEPYFQAFQQLAEKYHGRLHWGKGGTFDPAYLKQAYPQWETFRAIQKEEDPQGIFLNAFGRKILK